MDRDATRGESLPDEELEALRRRRFAERVGRVLEVMREEGIDWRGMATISADGRIVTRVVPVEARGG
jgi:hypothetical protein